jgi:hypothetical protein
MKDDDISGGEFSEGERQAIRRIIRDQERMEWFWATLRIWAGWISAAVIGTYAMYEVSIKFFKRMVGQ